MGGLPLCGPCFGLVLSETDPGRRRSLAALARLPDEVVERLARDPDAGVRARIASRTDLDPDRAARFADPAVESSPVVWRALAGSRTGADHAAALAASGDRLTGLILATNPRTPDEVMDQLARSADPEIAAAVAATRAGRSPEGSVIDQVLEARTITSRPLETAPPGTQWPGRANVASSAASAPAAATAATSPTASGGDDAPAGRRGLVIGFFVVLALVVAAVVIIGLGGDDQATTDPTTGPTTTVAGTAQSSTTDAPAPSTTPGPPVSETVVLEVTMRADQGRFCDSADMRLTYEGADAHVVVTDDADREIFGGSWPSGQTKTLDLIAPTETLSALVITLGDPATFSPSGTVDGTFC